MTLPAKNVRGEKGLRAPVLVELILRSAEAVALTLVHDELDDATRRDTTFDERSTLLDGHDGIAVAVQDEERRRSEAIDEVQW